MCRRQSRLLSQVGDRRVYFVHSYRAVPSPENQDWVLATSEYGGDFVSAVQKVLQPLSLANSIFACGHPRYSTTITSTSMALCNMARI